MVNLLHQSTKRHMEVTNGLVITMTYNPQSREELVAALEKADRAIVAAQATYWKATEIYTTTAKQFLDNLDTPNQKRFYAILQIAYTVVQQEAKAYHASLALSKHIDDDLFELTWGHN